MAVTGQNRTECLRQTVALKFSSKCETKLELFQWQANEGDGEE